MLVGPLPCVSARQMHVLQYADRCPLPSPLCAYTDAGNGGHRTRYDGRLQPGREYQFCQSGSAELVMTRFQSGRWEAPRVLTSGAARLPRRARMGGSRFSSEDLTLKLHHMWERRRVVVSDALTRRTCSRTITASLAWLIVTPQSFKWPGNC